MAKQPTDNDSQYNSDRIVASPKNTRRVDDALLDALKLVLNTNSEYAKSVSALLENDIDKERVNGELLSKTSTLLENQKRLIELLESFSDDYKEFLNEVLSNSANENRAFISDKFAPLFVKHGLKPDGTEHDDFVKDYKAIKRAVGRHFLSAIGGILFTILGRVIYLFLIK